MAKWKAFPHKTAAYDYKGEALKKSWARLHQGDAEPFPELATAQEAWRAYHRGDFAEAVELGLAAGPSGVNAANKATNIYATYLETADAAKLKLYEETIARAEKLMKTAPDNANAHYFHAQALGRYSQGISIGAALAQGLAGKVAKSLDKAIALEPKHSDAHIAYGAYHAEIIAKVGGMIGGLTYGASKDAAVKHYETAIKLNPHSAIARIEYANGLVMMFGDAKMKQALKLYEEAAAIKPLDAMERLDVEAAKEELAD
ncbi:MAG: hypothetical protein IPL47_01290 [Phyllobacteriaceae bacterium]|nr:hypothetical protein [Phyllobacteriaceae bacterium]